MLRRLLAVSKEEKTNYFLAWGIIAVSGFPFFYKTQLFILALLIIALFIYLKRSIVFNPTALSIIGVYFIVEILQILILNRFQPQTFAGTFMRLGTAFLVASICGKNYAKYYVNILYFFCIISFIFFIPSVTIPGFFNLFSEQIGPLFTPPAQNIIEFYKDRPTIIIFTFHEQILNFRNPGPFWEQGAFAIFILIAMMFNIMLEKKLWSKKNIIFSLTLISTLSTSGFVAFFMVIVSYYLVNEKLVKQILFLMILLPLAMTLYYKLEFMSDKISNNIEIAGDDNTSRFGSALSDLKDFSKSPFIGWGRGSMRFGGKKFTFFSEDQHRNNGLTGLLVTYGIFLFIFYFYNYFKSLIAICLDNGFNKNFAVFALFVIFILGFSQSIFQYPFFSSILFIHLQYSSMDSDRIALKDQPLLT